MKKNLPLFIAIFACSCSSNPDSISYSSAKIFQKIQDENNILSNWSTENKVVVHSTSEPDNLHPTNGNSGPRSEILLLTQRTLLYSDFENQKMIPGLTTDLPVESADKLRYTYHLKNGPKWDDETPLTREDILFTAKVFSCPLVNDPFVKTYWNNLKEIIFDQTDSSAFTCIMNTPNIQNNYWMGSFPILEKKFHDPKNILSHFKLSQFSDSTFNGNKYTDLSKWADDFNDDSNGRSVGKLNGLGMYKVTEWETGQYLTLEKKKNHWTDHSTDYHERAYPEKIIFKINRDDNAQLLEFKNQNFDVTSNISINTFSQLNSDFDFLKNYSGIISPTYNYTYIGINQRPLDETAKSFLMDKEVRKALAGLVDVNQFTQLVYGKYAGECSRMISNVSPYKIDFNKDLIPIKFDIHHAKAALTKAGWVDSNKDGVLDKIINGKSIEFRVKLNYLNNSPDWKDMALLFSEEMRQAGIIVQAIPMDLKLFLDKAKNHDFDLLMGSWSATSLPEDFSQLWHTKSWTSKGSNYCGFGNSTSDKLIETIKSETDISKRADLSKQLQKIIYEDQPYIFLYTSLKRNIIHKRFSNRMVFADRPGILINPLRLLSINPVITLTNGSTP